MNFVKLKFTKFTLETQTSTSAKMLDLADSMLSVKTHLAITLVPVLTAMEAILTTG